MQNFGHIHETFKEILTNAIVEGKKEQKKVFKTYINEMVKNPILKTQFQVYNKLENKSSAYTPSQIEKQRMLVDECINMLKELDVNAVIQENKNLVNYLKNKGFDLLEDYETKSLHEHITNLAFTKRNTKNIDSILESKIYLNQYSKPLNEKKENVETYINHFVGPVMVEKFNQKYLNKLSETERRTFKVIIQGTEEEKQDLYKGTIIECINLINDKLNEECTIQEKDKYLQVKDKLLRFEYNPDNFVSEMSKIAYLKDTLI